MIILFVLLACPSPEVAPMGPPSPDAVVVPAMPAEPAPAPSTDPETPPVEPVVEPVPAPALAPVVEPAPVPSAG